MIDNKLNEFGLKFGEGLDDYSSEYKPWFFDYSKYQGALANSSGILLSGEPGAGKSHIVDDVFNGALGKDKNCLLIRCHINGSSRKGRDYTTTLIEQLIESGNGLLILDNVDFSIYTGSRNNRSKAKVKEYGQFLKQVIDLSMSQSLSMFATCHNKEWRNSHSSIAEHEKWFTDLLPSYYFNKEFFDGNISLLNAVDILVRKGYALDKSTQIAQSLQDLGGLSFRNAYHMDAHSPDISDVRVALDQIETTKQQKIAGVKNT